MSESLSTMFDHTFIKREDLTIIKMRLTVFNSSTSMTDSPSGYINATRGSVRGGRN
jgi:hypothetical protein